MQKYGGIVGRVKIRTCQKPAQKIENTEQRKDAMRLNDAAVCGILYFVMMMFLIHVDASG
jgi:hypothetical protein